MTTPYSRPVVELCVDDTEGVRIAQQAGVNRVELCDALDVGGLTPALETILAVLDEAPEGGLQVIVRSRAGDFVYSDEEVAHMCADVECIRLATNESPVPVGFVVGAVTSSRRIDEASAAAFRKAAGERPLTFHRAFDMVSDQSEALETLIALGYERVLTTGGDESVAQVGQLRQLVELGGERISIIASGGVRAHNVGQIVRESGAPEVHMRAPGAYGGTDAAEVARILQALQL